MKNYVRTIDADDVLFFHGMDRVLPKESERGQIDNIRFLKSYLWNHWITLTMHTNLELQLRLEAEADECRNAEAEEIFAHDAVVKRRKQTRFVR